MGEYYDALETRTPEARRARQHEELAALLTRALPRLPVLAEWLGHPDAQSLGDPAALARLPVMRKPDLMALQDQAPPFGGLADPDALAGNRVFFSPGPVWEPQGFGADPWSAARALFAAGLRSGDIVHNAFSYHMTPGAFILDEGARALGCLVFPAGTGNTEAQVDAAARLKPVAYTGTPDFLKVLLDKADETGRDLSSIRRALVSGGALFPSMRDAYRSRGVHVFQCYATADLGVIAYEAGDDEDNPHPGLIVNETMIVEIVRPGTDETVPDGEVGEVVVTSLNAAYPLVRFGTGDLSAFIEGPSPCGRTGRRIAGWMGRADQRTKVKGMFVDPRHVASVVARHPEISRARLTVFRDGAQDAMRLDVEAKAPVDTAAIGATLSDITKLKGHVRRVEPGTLPNDGKVIVDERDYTA